MKRHHLVPAAICAFALAACASPSAPEDAPPADPTIAETSASASAVPEGEGGGPEEAVAAVDKESFRAGLEGLVFTVITPEELTAAGLDEDAIDEYFSCITDATYETLSAPTLAAVADTDVTAQLTEEDRAALLSAVHDCASAQAR